MKGVKNGRTKRAWLIPALIGDSVGEMALTNGLNLKRIA